MKNVSSEEVAISMSKNLTALCQKGGFHLTVWISNSHKVLQSISEDHRAKELNLDQLNLYQDKLPIERVLALQWSVEADTFQFKISVKNQPCTMFLIKKIKQTTHLVD